MKKYKTTHNTKQRISSEINKHEKGGLKWVEFISFYLLNKFLRSTFGVRTLFRVPHLKTCEIQNGIMPG